MTFIIAPGGGNITTEYEERYLNQGLPIYGLTAYKLNSYDLGLV